MKRLIVLGALVLAGVSSLAVRASQDQAPKKVSIITMNVMDILYVLTGGGGNSLAMMRDDGVVLVDSKLPGWGRPILEAIQSVSDKPVTTIINTHTHGDHTGSNIEFPTVTEIVAHENTKTNMAKMDAFKGANARFLPNKTVGEKLSLFDGLDRIDLYYFGRGHTDGDVVVVFPGKGVAHFGDLFPAKMAPIIDTTNGGSGSAYPETLAKAASAVTGIDRVVTGHFAARAPMRAGVPGSVIYTFFDTLRWSDVREYADFVREFVAAVQSAKKAGKTVDEAVAGLTLPERFKGYDMGPAKRAAEAIYSETK